MGREIKLDVFLGVSEAKATFLRTLDQPALANWLRIVLKDAGCPHPRGQSIELLYPDTVHFFWVVWEPNVGAEPRLNCMRVLTPQYTGYHQEGQKCFS